MTSLKILLLFFLNNFIINFNMKQIISFFLLLVKIILQKNYTAYNCYTSLCSQALFLLSLGYNLVKNITSVYFNHIQFR